MHQRAAHLVQGWEVRDGDAHAPQLCERLVRDATGHPRMRQRLLRWSQHSFSARLATAVLLLAAVLEYTDKL